MPQWTGSADYTTACTRRSGSSAEPSTAIGGDSPELGCVSSNSRLHGPHLVICKPDAVERGSSGEILARFERRTLKIVAAELRAIDRDLAAQHYAEHDGKGFYDDLVAFIGRSPALVFVVEGPEDTWKAVRAMMGATNPRDSAPGTIRGDFGIDFTENLIHGSDSAESAAREIGIFFPAPDLGLETAAQLGRHGRDGVGAGQPLP